MVSEGNRVLIKNVGKNYSCEVTKKLSRLSICSIPCLRKFEGALQIASRKLPIECTLRPDEWYLHSLKSTSLLLIQTRITHTVTTHCPLLWS